MGLCCILFSGWAWATILLALILYRSFRQRIFAFILSNIVTLHNGKVRQEKLALFKHLSSMVSSDPVLRGKGAIRILELGAGTGANFDFYPENCRLVIIEPNTFSKEYFENTVAKYPGIVVEAYIPKKVEDLSESDLASFQGKVDAVVSTMLCCSVSNVPGIYKFASDTLAPGGKYLFLDHILDSSEGLLSFIQKLLDSLHIWPGLFDGCHLSRPIDKMMKKAEGEGRFSNVKVKTFYISMRGLTVDWLFLVLQSHAWGVATK